VTGNTGSTVWFPNEFNTLNNCYMKTIITISLGLLALSRPLTAEDLLLVKWMGGAQSEFAQNGNRTIGAVSRREFKQIGWQLVALPEGLSAFNAMKRYQLLPGVIATELTPRSEYCPTPLVKELPSSTGPAHSLDTNTPNDPRHREQWYLPQIGAPEAWKVSTGSTNTVIAIVDTGVDYNHPDLAPNMWHNPGETGLDANGHDRATNGIDDDANGYVDDLVGANVLAGNGDPMDQGYIQNPFPVAYHGTLCAGVIGAAGNNEIGITGINWAIQMTAVRISGGDTRDLQGHPDSPFYENMIAGLDYVLMMKRRGVNIRVVSNSYYTPIPGEALHDAVKALAEEGVICVFVAGNEAFDLDLNSGFPGCFNLPNVLTVANTDRSGVLNPGSSLGKGTIDIAAPGTDILTTTKGGLYATVTGTSFACPLVAGACALVLSAHPELGIEELKGALFGSVDNYPALNGKVFTNGRLNVARALELISHINPAPIITTALPAGRPTPANFPVQITFNRAMDRISVQSSFSITPAIEGTFEWAADNRSFSYKHSTLFNESTNYTVRIAATAKDATVQTLDGNFNRLFETSPVDDFTWTFRFSVANDDKNNAIPLIGDFGTISGDNRYTTWEPREPQPVEFGAQIRANTVWYSFLGPR
jgi:subtilisin family serine protease